jgi:hypothetical protein
MVLKRKITVVYEGKEIRLKIGDEVPEHLLKKIPPEYFSEKYADKLVRSAK